MTEIAYGWHPIEELSTKERNFSDSGLNALVAVWNEQREELTEKGFLKEFTLRLKRQWAIETGVIEHVYTLDKGITQVLIEKGIDANVITHEMTDRDPLLVGQIIRDQYDVVDGLFDFVKSDRSLSTSYIKELHACFCKNRRTTTGLDQFGRVHEIPLIVGDYKKQPNSPMQTDGLPHEYCPPEQTASEMDRLIAFHEEHLRQNISPIIEAAWLHHRFTQIHPFQDGNGRIARALASLVLIKAKMFPLTVTREDREVYINALNLADKNNLIPLIELFAKIQRNTFTLALSIAGRVKESAHTSSVIDSIKLQLESRGQEKRKTWENAKTMANRIMGLACEEMESTAMELKQKLGSLWNGTLFPSASKALFGEEQDYYFRSQIVQTAKELGYFANLSLYRSWARLKIPGKSQSEILVSAHGIGKEFRGVLSISACFFCHGNDDEVGAPGDYSVLGGEAFQLTYRENEKDLQRRFLEWLNRVLAEGVAFWGRSV